MSRSISPNALAQIVAGLLVNPDLLAEIGSPAKHQAFIRDIGEVVASYCGGEVRAVSAPAGKDNSLANDPSRPALRVYPNDSLPSLLNNVWANQNPGGWDNEYLGQDSVPAGEPLSEGERVRLNRQLKAILEPESTAILKALIDDIQQTGGLLNFSDGLSAPAIDPTWTDLGYRVFAAHRYLHSLGETVPLTFTDVDYPSKQAEELHC